MKSFFLFLIGLALSTQALQARTFEEILASHERPTMSEVYPHLREIRRLTGFPTHGSQVQPWFDERLNIQYWLPQLLENGPKMIAQFEKIYPGATWVFLGRDGLPWADLFEAYYTSIGQRERVIRLGISKPSMHEVSDKTLLELMRSHNIPVDTLDKSHPVIFVDSVSKGYGSQGRRLMGVLYANWMSLGNDPLALLGKVDMIGMIVSTFQGFANPLRFKVLHQYLQSLYLKSLNRNHRGEYLANNLRVLTYDLQHNAANEAGYTHFFGAWHKSFQAIRRTEKGYAAQPGPVFPEEMRKTVLYTQGEIWKFVESGECATRVNNWANSFGFTMPMSRPRRVNPNLEKLFEYHERLERRSGWEQVQTGQWSHYNLPQVLMTEPLAPKDYPAVVQAFAEQMQSLEGFDWYTRAQGDTALSDIQFLQKALGTDCEQLLKAGGE